MGQVVDIPDLEKLFDVKLDGLKDQMHNLKGEMQGIHKRVDSLISVLKWSVGICLTVLSILVAVVSLVLTLR